MLMQSTSRNQRSKGFKIKHAVQICLLLAVGIWLLYQAKHSHGEGAGHEQTSASIAEIMQGRSSPQILKFGRKNLQPKIEEYKVAVEKDSDKEKGKFAYDDEDLILKAGGGGDHEIDGHDQLRAEEDEIDEEEDFLDEEGEIEEEIEDDETDVKDKEVEDVVLSEDEDHYGLDRTSQDALEKHYKGIDASNAVVQNTHTMIINAGTGALRKTNEQQLVEKPEKVGLEQENQSNTINGETSNGIWSTTHLKTIRTAEDKQLGPNVVIPSTTSDLNLGKRYLADSTGDFGNLDTAATEKSFASKTLKSFDDTYDNYDTFKNDDTDLDGGEEELDPWDDLEEEPVDYSDSYL